MHRVPHRAPVAVPVVGFAVALGVVLGALAGAATATAGAVPAGAQECDPDISGPVEFHAVLDTAAEELRISGSATFGTLTSSGPVALRATPTDLDVYVLEGSLDLARGEQQVHYELTDGELVLAEPGILGSLQITATATTITTPATAQATSGRLEVDGDVDVREPGTRAALAVTGDVTGEVACPDASSPPASTAPTAAPPTSSPAAPAAVTAAPVTGAGEDLATTGGSAGMVALGLLLVLAGGVVFVAAFDLNRRPTTARVRASGPRHTDDVLPLRP